jgi:hypothetical protein
MQFPFAGKGKYSYLFEVSVHMEDTCMNSYIV